MINTEMRHCKMTNPTILLLGSEMVLLSSKSDTAEALLHASRDNVTQYAQQQIMAVGSASVHEEPRSLDEPLNRTAVAEEAWNKYNLLSLDGGGVRGYWSLLCLQFLMERIAAIEEELSEDEDGDEKIDSEKRCSSFSPESYPPNVSHVPLSDEENTERRRAGDKVSSRRYLPCHYFDYIGGSSTGALIAIMLGRLRMTVLDCIMEYKSLGGEVFGSPRLLTELKLFPIGIHRKKYDANKLKKVFEDVTRRRIQGTEQIQPATTFKSERYLCRTFVLSLMNMSKKKTMASVYMIRSYDHYRRSTAATSKAATTPRGNQPQRRSTNMSSGKPGNTYGPQNPPKVQVRSVNTINYGDAENFEIWQAARAATAAPGYFDPLRIGDRIFEDGGFGKTNNPTLEGTYEIEEASGPESIGIVVSVGTARKDKPPKKNLGSKVRSKMNEATDPNLVHREMVDKSKILQDTMSYYRLNPTDQADEQCRLDIKLDQWNPRHSLFRSRSKSGSKTIKEMEDLFYRWITKHWVQLDFDSCASKLVECRQARTYDGAKWESYATGAIYTCRIQGCQKPEFYHRDQFGDHIKDEHQVPEPKVVHETNRCRKNWVYRSQDGT